MTILKPTVIYAKTIPEAWWLCISDLVIGIKSHVYTIDRGSKVGQRRLEFDSITVHVEYPGAKPIIPDVRPPIPPPTTQQYVEDYLPYLMTSKKKPNEQYTYGQFLEPQIEKVIQMYKQDGFNTNQAYMAVGDMDSINLPDPPCLRGIDTRIWHNKLHFFVYFRSWDLWAGFPSNLASIQILKDYMASEIGVEDGELIAFSKGLHLYEEVWPFAELVANAEMASRQD